MVTRITDVSQGAVHVRITNEPALISLLEGSIPAGFRRTDQTMERWVFMSPFRGTALDVLSEWSSIPVRRPVPPPTEVERLYRAGYGRPLVAS